LAFIKESFEKLEGRNACHGGVIHAQRRAAKVDPMVAIRQEYGSLRRLSHWPRALSPGRTSYWPFCRASDNAESQRSKTGDSLKARSHEQAVWSHFLSEGDAAKCLDVIEAVIDFMVQIIRNDSYVNGGIGFRRATGWRPQESSRRTDGDIHNRRLRMRRGWTDPAHFLGAVAGD
jgi:hypothetical protein